jgi:hypothetical protein
VIKIKDSYENIESEGIPIIYGKSNEPEFLKNYNTSCSYHFRQPEFSDEIKIELPLQLNNNHHILFTFYHVNCKEGNLIIIKTKK